MMKTLRVVIGLTIGLGLGAGGAWAEQTDFAIGGAAASELRIGLGPRPVAMGEAFTGLADDYNATLWNPAGLALAGGLQAGFMHSLYLDGATCDYLAGAQSLFTGAGLGAAVSYFSFGSLDKLDETGLKTDSFTPATLSLAVGYGQKFLDVFAAGATMKYLRQTIDTETYSAVGADLGLRWDGPYALSLAAVAQNLGTEIAGSRLSSSVKLGAAYGAPFAFAAGDDWRLAADLALPTADTAYTTLHLGTEYWIQGVLAARAGYKVKNTEGLGGGAGWSAGLGARYAAFQLDYSLASFGDLGLTHQLAVSFGY